MTDHYQTLGVAKNATPDEIKKAYRRMAAIHHPDKGGDTAEFQKIQTAYETLSDPQKKQQYDNPNPFGGMHGGPFNGGGFHFDFGGPGGFHFQQNGFDINDLFGGMFGGGGRQYGRGPHTSYKTTLHVTLEQIYNGDEQTVNIHGPNGPQTIKVNIPKGIDNGATLRYENIIPNAILLVEFRVYPHAKFERDGVNLFSVQEMNVLDLIIGTTIKFKTLSGKELDVNVPPRTQPGSKLRIVGEGMPYQNGQGDQYILLKPHIPDIIDVRIIDAIKQFK